ncbi:MAG: GTP 3',8-cyclase MoaA [Planctomycetes bacterium]|nr:GTP 3',8-cyclase MoaA [Planctomycetota bacterium]
MSTSDALSRPLRKLRISITDRCNLRCAYCMPAEEYRWLPKRELLSFEEIERLARIVRELGVREIRLTGGEPLLRRDVEELVTRLANLGFDKLAMTTNGMFLADHVDELHAAGMTSVTVSLDTLQPERFERLTRRTGLDRTLDGIRAAVAAGFDRPKINTVVMRGFNDDEIFDMLEFAREVGAEPRFIEYMDVGGATDWRASEVVSRREILERIHARYGTPEPLVGRGAAPSEQFELPNGQRFGIIASTTMPFCGACDRARLVADGRFFTCLYSRAGVDLRSWLRSKAMDDDIRDLIAGVWRERDDRGAEKRLELAARSPLASRAELANDPHLEMHTRGG